jgi:hypothetical protein
LSISFDLLVGSEIILLYFYGKRRILSSNFDPQGKDLLVDSFFPRNASSLRKNGASLLALFFIMLAGGWVLFVAKGISPNEAVSFSIVSILAYLGGVWTLMMDYRVKKGQTPFWLSEKRFKIKP